MNAHTFDQRRAALEAARLAVRAYAHDPCDQNEARLESALQQIRQLRSEVMAQRSSQRGR